MHAEMSRAQDDGTSGPATPAGSFGLAADFRRVRAASVALVSGLEPEDTAIQSMADTSPTKWHLAHTSWFFEHFVLARDPRHVALQPGWDFLFNSYYQSIGPMHARPQRGLLSRPTLAQVLDYRARVDERVQRVLAAEDSADLRGIVTLGLNHEQQHQELILTDLKHLFSMNPLEPVYRTAKPAVRPQAAELRFIAGGEGLTAIGASGAGFAFDCETPRHPALLYPHAIANRLVTNAEFADFVREGGYRTPTLWMAEGWNVVTQRGWQHPLYWSADLASEFSLGGRVAIDPGAPVSHLSFFEADAFARWAGARLPTEVEWESAASTLVDTSGNFVDSGELHPRAASVGMGLRQMFGDVWEWTSSPYVSYPGYRALPGALGEYNGKFMCGQYVLRGGSCATPADHIRATYRNFFTPADRWQFAGLRLGKDL